MINISLAVVTALSLIVAAIMTFVAWRTVRDERRRAAARVAILAAAIHEDSEPLGRSPAGEGQDGVFVARTAQPTARLAVVGVVALIALGAVTGLVLLAEAGSHGRPVSGRVHVERPADVPLELIALEHDRDENRLVVRGIVRNPPSAAKLDGLTAVVLVFSKDGAYIASERAPLAVAPLAPGADAPFVVTLPDADSVDRYRVSFRTDDRIVPHVDRRGRTPVARTE
jgi:predicted permease